MQKLYWDLYHHEVSEMVDFSSIDPKEVKVEGVPKCVPLPSSRTIIRQSVLNEIKSHGRSNLREEVCGVLVGSLCEDPKEGTYLKIDARIEGRHAEHQAGSVTFKSETLGFHSF